MRNDGELNVELVGEGAEAVAVGLRSLPETGIVALCGVDSDTLLTMKTT